ncbi:MAG: LuxR C-terminal-related transcriptional regulator [Dehalococcoidia bacterium]
MRGVREESVAGGSSSRERELAAVVAQFAAAGGGARAVLVTGEPGIGKSWVLARAAELLQSRGARLLSGYALELQGLPPHFPLARAFGPALRDDPTLAELTEARAVLGGAGIGPAGGALPEPPAIGADGAALRAFDALADVCRVLAATQPLVLMLDDLQWAADPVWDVVQYLVRTLPETPLLVLVAARDEVMREPGGAGARSIAELLRQRLLIHLPLRALDEQAVARLAAERLGGDVAPELVERLARRSEGNPFFAEEMLQDFGERGVLSQRRGVWHLAPHTPDAAPATLQLAIGVRLDRLPAACEEALAAGAILGREFGARTLATALGGAPEGLRDRLAPAEVAGLIDATAGGWRFRHDTVREALLTRHASEAELLHAAAARAIAESAGYAPSIETLTALAHHWELAQAPAKAGPAALAAARASAAIHALPEALRYARAAHAWCERAGNELPPDVLLEATRAHGEAALAAGAYGEAADAHRATTELARMAGDAGLEGRAWLGLGDALRRQERPGEAAACYAEALRLLEAGGRTRDVAEVLVALCDLDGLTLAQYAEAREAGQRALRLARQIGERGIEARATLALANVESRAADPGRARALLEGALEHALAADDLVLAAEVCGSLANACYWTGELRRSRSYSEQRLQLARRAADPFALRHAHSWLALVAATLGEWDEARRLLDESERALAGIDNPEPAAFLQVVRGFMAFRLGVPGEAREHLEAALAVFEQLGDETMLWYASLLALVCVAEGRDERARGLAAEQERRLAAIDASALPARSARCALGLVYAALGDREAGAGCEAALRPYAGDFHWSPARRTLAALSALAGDLDAARGELAAAEAALRAEAMRPDLALVLLDRAALTPRGSRAALLAEARGLLEELGMGGELTRLELLERAEPRAGGPAGLSAREVEVLRLIVEGKTNREIAAALVISERTVANHLAHIFTKIDADNRAAAAAFALRNGLA